MKKAISPVLLTAVAIVFTGNPASVRAQDAPIPAGSPEAIETVVVTAQKREQDVQDVPISMEVFQGRQLENFHTSDFKSLMNYVPNLLVQPSPGNDAIYIRGFGSPAANYAFEQSVSLYEDGIYGGRNRQFMAPFFDVERIEVLRGPQGALLGKNTAAGAVNIITAGPTDHFEASATAAYNFSRSGIDAFGYVSGPLTDTLSARVALKFTYEDGYIGNTATGTNDPRLRDNLGRISLRYQPTDNFNVTTKFEYADFRTLGTNQIRVAPAAPQLLSTEKDAASPFGTAETDTQDSYNSSTTANLELGDFTLTSITGFSAFKDNKFVGGSAGDPESWLSTFNEKFNQVSQEIRLLSPTGQRFEYIVGAYYDQSDYHLLNPSRYDLFGGTLVGQTHIAFRQHSSTWSLFGQGTFHVTDDLRLLGSLRYTENHKRAAFDEYLDFGIPIAAPRSIPLTTLTEDNLDPSVTVQYDIQPGVMVYATYGRGSKAGGFVSNTRTVTPDSFVFGDEKSTNYEIGAKATLFDGRVIADVDLYDTKFRDLQVSDYDPSQATFITKNAARATGKGVEASLQWLALDNLEFSGSVAYLEAAYDDFPGAACLATQPQPPCSAPTNNIAGTPLPGASKWSGNVQGDFHQPLNDDLKLSLTGIVSFRSTFATASDLSPYYGTQSSYAKFDARIELAHIDDRWSVALVGKNLTNNLTESFSYLWPLSTPATGVVFLDETRTISLEGRIRF